MLKANDLEFGRKVPCSAAKKCHCQMIYPMCEWCNIVNIVCVIKVLCIFIQGCFFFCTDHINHFVMSDYFCQLSFKVDNGSWL